MTSVLLEDTEERPTKRRGGRHIKTEIRLM